ncbi:MAG: hypothetical protein ACI8PZ_001023 [Myxococcota bacterium]
MHRISRWSAARTSASRVYPSGLGVERCGLLAGILLSAALALPGVATASSFLDGDLIQIAYDDEGQWGFDGVGVQVWDGEWLEATWPGLAWNQITVAWDAPDPMSIAVNQGDDGFVSMEADLSVDAVNEAVHSWGTADLQVEKTERWTDSASVLVVSYRVENTGRSPISNVRLSHGVDWDQDYTRFFTYPTANDVRDDGWLALSAGPDSGLTLAFGVCDPRHQQVGFSAWDVSADPVLSDPDAGVADETMHVRTVVADELAPGEAAEFQFLVVYGTTAGAATALYESQVGGLCDRMLLSPPDPGVAGVSNSWTGRGAEPGDRVYMLVGDPGEGEIPGCPGVATAITRPRVLGPVTADPTGNVRFEAMVPPGIAGERRRMQLADRAACRVSNAVDATF